jgi:CheY-like chemotaxis protein
MGSLIVLIVEDDPMVITLWKRFLSPVVGDSSENPRIATNLTDAMTEMSKEPFPDLVLLDLRLPIGGDEDGMSTPETTLERIKHFKNINPNVVVMVVTGANGSNLPSLAEKMGADAFAQKLDLDSQSALLQAVRGVYQNRASDPTKPIYARSVEIFERLTAATNSLTFIRQATGTV